MTLGRRGGDRQGEFWTANQDLPRGPGHVFYDKLNAVLARAGFDRTLEELCAPYYATSGRASIPPGVYFRMLMIGYLEGLDSQRGIAWRCEDSLSLRRFLGIPLGEETPDHSSLTRIRDRLPLELHERVFQRVLSIIDEHGLLTAKTVGVDSTLLEANAAMKSIVRKDSGEQWKAYLKRLMKEQGLIGKDDDPPDDELRRFDQQRRKAGEKKTSNAEWESPSDPDGRIVKMKDGRTHLGYKAEHVIDLESEIILSATVHHGTEHDTQTLAESLVNAQRNLVLAGSAENISGVAADKGYHSNETLVVCECLEVTTYIPEPKSPHGRRWTNKSARVKRAVLNNRRRWRRAKGKNLQKQRSEKVERSFAHVCETGGARRTWLRGLTKIAKRYVIVAAARNLGLLMLKVFGLGKPRSLSGAAAAAFRAFAALWATILTALLALASLGRPASRFRPTSADPLLFQPA